MWEEKLKLYDKLVENNSNFERKGKTMPYTSVNGYMFSQLNKAGEIGIRLPKEQAKQFVKDYNSGPFLSYGAVMREYVLIPEHILKDTDLVSKLLYDSYNYTKSLPPKPHKK